jgi:hypothetical protein
MQVYEQTGISATVTLTAAELGYNPKDYTHHMITMSALTNPASDTFSIQGRIAGTSTYGYIAALLSEQTLYLVADFKLDAFKITFTAATAAILTIASVVRVGSETR